MLATVIVALAYLRWCEGRRGIAAMTVASIVLLASNYMNFLALYVVLAADYFIWGRNNRRLSLKEALVLLLPQLLIGGAIVLTWNPLRGHVSLDTPVVVA